MTKYLYGAEVNGIQSYIFETGKLKEIVGGSEIVDNLCSDLFIKNLMGPEVFHMNSLLISAAGKIQYIFEGLNAWDDCQNWILTFSKTIAKKAPGLSVSQAVVSVRDQIAPDDFKKLGERLNTQKNKAFPIASGGIMIADRVPRTGGAVVKEKVFEDEVEKLDKVQEAKRAVSDTINKEGATKVSELFKKFLDEDVEPYKKHFATDFEDLLGSKDTGWIAVIHADGNSLGKTIKDAREKLKDNAPHKLKAFTKEFSETLDKATKTAVKMAFNKVVRPQFEKELAKESDMEPDKRKKTYVGMRPIILGGDDLTLIIRGEWALDFTAEYLMQFEELTRNIFEPLANAYKISEVLSLSKGLSACAGIAYIKHNYPFHYGIDLAEGLCKYAKKISKQHKKGKVPSSLTFHKIQSSFVEEYEDIIKEELIANSIKRSLDGSHKNQAPNANIHLNFGPYFLNNNPEHPYALIGELNSWVRQMGKKHAPRGPIREWLAELSINPERAEQMMNRIWRINRHFRKDLPLENPSPRTDQDPYKLYTPLYDILSIASIHKKQ